MEIERLVLFAAAYLAVVVLPGPTVTALVARVLARGPRGSWAYIAGLVLGALTWFAVAAAGLAALAAAHAAMFVAIRYVGAAYLLYLAWKLWTAPSGSPQIPRDVGETRGLFLAGLAINLGNPKAIAFFLALLPSVIEFEALGPVAFGALAAVIVVIVSGVLGAYVLLASCMRGLFASPRSIRLVNRSSSVVVAGTAVAVATR